MTTRIVPSILLTGPSGVGKSTLLRGALLAEGSGAIALAPGLDEANSYYGMLDNPSYVFKGFDDVLYQPALGEHNATAVKELLEWLKKIYAEVSADVAAGKPPRYAVLGIDTINSAVGRASYNWTMAKFKRTEPPAAQSPDGAAFYGYLRLTQESIFRLMRAIRGLGVMWIVTAHPTEAEVSEILKTEADPSSKKIMPDMPGGFRNVMPAAFDFHFMVGVAVKEEGQGKDKKLVRKHYLQWLPDPKRPSKSRLPGLSTESRIPANWLELRKRIDDAAQVFAGLAISSTV